MINECNPTRRESEWLENSSPKSYVRCIACNACSWYFPERKFFRFPKDPERSKEWAIACGKRFLLDMSSSDLYNKCRICSAHFVDSDFRTLKKHFLHSYAKPSKFSKTESCGRMYLNNFACSRLQLNSPGSSSYIDREALIERVKSYPVLYNPLHEDYAYVEMKENVWNKIAQQLKCASGYKVKEQWLKLRDGYKSALRRQKMKENGRCEAKKSWAYEKQMEFLLPFLKDRCAPASVKKTADGEKWDLFQEECNVQDQDSRSSSSIVTCDNAFHNNYLSSECSASKISPVTEGSLNESSMISDDRDTPDQETADEESSVPFQKEHDFQDQEGNSSFRRIAPDHTFHNYHLPELLRPDQIKLEPSSETEILLDKSSICEDMDRESRRTTFQKSIDEESSGPLQQKSNLQGQVDSSSLKGTFSAETFHDYFTSKPLKLMQTNSPSTSRSIVESSISDDRDFKSRQTPHQGISGEESSGSFQRIVYLQGQDNSSLRKAVLADTFHNYLSSKPSRAMQVKSPLSKKRSLDKSNIVSKDRDFKSKKTVNSIYNNEIKKTDALYQFFMSMYYTTKTLPRSLQIKVQKTIFDVVLEEEESVLNI